ncbi:MAG: hypothetical protein WC401_07235 [Bacteroidales bacterium]
MEPKIIKPKVDKAKLYRLAFNIACNVLVHEGYYKSTKSAEASILRLAKKGLI